MSEPILSGSELLQWADETAEKWFQFLAETPVLFSLSCDIAQTKSVAELLQHIVAVELRYAERLAGQEVTPYEKVPYGSLEEIAATHAKAVTLYRQLLQNDQPWDEVIEFVTRTAGTMQASRRKTFFHAHLHSIRHYAQLATLAGSMDISPAG